MIIKKKTQKIVKSDLILDSVLKVDPIAHGFFDSLLHETIISVFFFCRSININVGITVHELD